MTTPVLVLLAGGLGLLVGSFLNVVVHRVPLGLSVVSPASRCPSCETLVRPYDNVPVVSWVALRGRCRDCSAPIAIRYPFVELVTGLLFAVVAATVGPAPYLGAALALTAGGVALCLIDLDHRRLPFPITIATAGLASVFLVADAIVRGPSALVTASVSAAVWLAVYAAAWLVTGGRGMGLGDVALAPVLGLVLGAAGWGPSLVGLLAGFVVGAVVGILLVATGLARRGTKVPHGPFMLAGAALGFFAGEPLWRAYLALMGLA